MFLQFSIIILDNIRQDNVCDMLNLPISDQEIRESIYSLKSDKSPGPDGICAEIYKITWDYICPYIRLMFNDFFDRGEVPDSFGASIISPIHKSGSFDVPGNFRGISLINTLCKIFMGIMNTRLQNWCNEFGVIDEAQAGFRKNYSTIDNIFCLHALGQKYLSKSKVRFYCLFIDFAKAFDSVDHDKLCDALVRKGVGGKYLKIMQSMYSKVRSCVKTPQG